MLVVNIHRIGRLRHAVVKAAARPDIIFGKHIVPHQPPGFTDARNGGKCLEIAAFKAWKAALEERENSHGRLAGIQHHFRNGTRAHRIADMPGLRAIEPQHIPAQRGVVIDLYIATVTLGQRAFLNALAQQPGEGIETFFPPKGVKLHGEMVAAKAVTPFLKGLLHAGYIHAAHGESQRHGLVFPVHAAIRFTAAGQRQPRAACTVHKCAGRIANHAGSGIYHDFPQLPPRQPDARHLRAIKHFHAISGTHPLQIQLGHLRAGKIRIAREAILLHGAL